MTATNTFTYKHGEMHEVYTDGIKKYSGRCPRCHPAGSCMDCGAANARICQPCADKRKAEKRNASRRARHQAMLDLGLVRVRGALGGIYYE